jgi:dynein light chain 1
MSKATTLAKALQNWEAEHPGEAFVDAVEIKLCFQFPPIERLETTVLAQLAKC